MGEGDSGPVPKAEAVGDGMLSGGGGAKPRPGTLAEVVPTALESAVVRKEGGIWINGGMTKALGAAAVRLSAAAVSLK